jgi:hypothetical protein
MALVTADHDLYGTMTQSEVLRSRGYPAELVSGNGAVARLEPAAVAVAEATAESDEEGRRCSECHRPVPAEFPARRTTCSPACSGRREKRQRTARSSRSGASSVARRSAPSTVAEPVVAVPRSNLFGLLENLAGQLGPGWSAEVAAIGITLTWRPVPR